MYVFEHPKTGEQIELFFSMNDDKKYTDKKGVEWKRVFMGSQLSTVGKVDPWNNADFVNKTAQKKGTVGNMMDLSKELSEQRAKDNGGVDPVKEKYYKDYSKARGGAKHMDQMKKSFENKNIKIDFD